MITTFILVRHGESEANYNGIFAGNYDADLKERGMLQAERTSQYILENYKVDKVYASDLKRAYKTGKSFSDIAGVEIVKSPQLREIKAGEWDGKKFTDIMKLYEKDYGVWLSDIGNARCTGGESVKELGERVMGELLKIAKENEGKTVLIATHATPIRVTQTLIQNGDLSEMKNVPWVSNASVSVFEYENNVWNILKISDDSHLGELKTNLPKNV